MEVSNASPKAWGWILAYGVILVLLGLFAISAAAFTTMISIIFLGSILVIGGLVIIMDSFHSRKGKTNSFFLTLLMGILYLVAGILLALHPLPAAVSLTLLLALLFIILGTLRIASSLSLRLHHWGWALVNGIVTLGLGILILAHWPASSLVVIGLFVGIDLLFVGWTYVLLAFAAKSNTQKI